MNGKHIAIVCGYILCGDEIIPEFVTARQTGKGNREIAKELLLEIVKYGDPFSPEEIRERYIDGGDGMGVSFYHLTPRLEWVFTEVFSPQELRQLIGISDEEEEEYVWEGPSIGEMEPFLPDDVEVYSAFAIPDFDEF